MDAVTAAIDLAIGLGVGFTIGMTGVGGGVLAVPALILLAGMPASAAVGTASIFILATQCLAVWQHRRLGNIDGRVAAIFLAGAVPGVLAASIAISAWSASAADPADAAALQSFLKQLIAAAMVPAIALMAWDLWKSRRTDPTRPSAPRIRSVGGLRGVLGVGCGLLLGGLIGATAVGGGVLVVPLLIALFRLRAVRAVGTASLVAVVLFLASGLAYGMSGQAELATAVLMSAASFVGVALGSRLATGMPDRALKWIVLAILMLAVALMVLRSLG